MRNLLIYSLVSKLDQWLNSPYCILALSKRQLTKIKENDHLGIVLGTSNKIDVRPQENCLKTVCVTLPQVVCSKYSQIPNSCIPVDIGPVYVVDTVKVVTLNNH